MKIAFYFLISFFVIHHASAHQMDKLGPNGGYVKMPGAYHVEVVDKGDVLNVYLLDIQFKNPLTENSSVAVTYYGSQPFETECKKQEHYFVCPLPKAGLTSYKRVSIKSVRNKIKAGLAVYDLPLKLPK